MKLTKMSLGILKSFRSKQNLQLVADKFNIGIEVLRNNYFSWFWRSGYIMKVSKGFYTLSEKGKKKIKDTEILYNIDSLILRETEKGRNNREIINLILKKYYKILTDRQVYDKISWFKKKYYLKDRRKVGYRLPKRFSSDLAELIGLVFSDGCINKDGVSFYNKDAALLERFQHLVYEAFSLRKPYKRERRQRFFEINYYSMGVANFLNKLTQNKSLIPTQILNGSKDIKISFLRCYFSGDGCIVLSIPHKKFYNKFQVYSFLFLACRKINISKQVQTIFSSLGYTTSVKPQGLVILKYDDIIKFYNEIGFINNSKIADYSRNWKGFEKNQILKYVATTLKKDKELHNLRYGNRNLVIKHIQGELKKIVSKNY